MATKKPRSTKGLSTLDGFLAEEGVRETFQAVAIKEVLAWQIEQAMKTEKLSKKRPSERMGTSRSQVSRLLDPKDGNVTLATLQRAAEMLGRKVRLELIERGRSSIDRLQNLGRVTIQTAFCRLTPAAAARARLRDPALRTRFPGGRDRRAARRGGLVAASRAPADGRRAAP